MKHQKPPTQLVHNSLQPVILHSPTPYQNQNDRNPAAHLTCLLKNALLPLYIAARRVQRPRARARSHRGGRDLRPLLAPPQDCLLSRTHSLKKKNEGSSRLIMIYIARARTYTGRSGVQSHGRSKAGHLSLSEPPPPSSRPRDFYEDTSSLAHAGGRPRLARLYPRPTPRQSQASSRLRKTSCKFYSVLLSRAI